jgi:hypothetical protein
MDEEIQNSDKIVMHTPEGRFAEGHPKIGGKVKGTRHFTTIVQEALAKLGTTEKGEKIEVQKALGEKVVKMALEGNEQMIKLIWNYLDGLPKATLGIDTPDETKDILKGILDKMNGIKPE